VNKDEFKVRAGRVKQLAAVGEKLISHFKDYIDENVSEELVVQNENSPYRLRVLFHGLSLLFRVELRLRTGGGDGAIAVYRLSYEREPTEIPLKVRYVFDGMGNVKKEGAEQMLALSDDECAAPFFADVFTQLATQDDIILRP
jgi:hypothetical protein